MRRGRLSFRKSKARTRSSRGRSRKSPRWRSTIRPSASRAGSSKNSDAGAIVYDVAQAGAVTWTLQNSKSSPTARACQRPSACSRGTCRHRRASGRRASSTCSAGPRCRAADISPRSRNRNGSLRISGLLSAGAERSVVDERAAALAASRRAWGLPSVPSRRSDKEGQVRSSSRSAYYSSCPRARARTSSRKWGRRNCQVGPRRRRARRISGCR